MGDVNSEKKFNTFFAINVQINIKGIENSLFKVNNLMKNGQER